jgi:hypothetical protein
MQSFPAMSGDELVLPITVRDNDDALVNLSGASARFAMARRPEANTTDIDSAASPATASVIFTDAINGLITVTITDENTDALEGDYYYECKVTDSTGREAVTNRGWISFAINLT